jgi:hypothetical protein
LDSLAIPDVLGRQTSELLRTLCCTPVLIRPCCCGGLMVLLISPSARALVRESILDKENRIHPRGLPALVDHEGACDCPHPGSIPGCNKYCRLDSLAIPDVLER